VDAEGGEKITCGVKTHDRKTKRRIAKRSKIDIRKNSINRGESQETRFMNFSKKEPVARQSVRERGN